MKVNAMDKQSWPSGDGIWKICHAIAHAEGYGTDPSNNPTRLHNPGDISDGATKHGYELHSGSHVTNFPDDETGWRWLYNKVRRAANGESEVFLPEWTWTQFAQKWAGDWQHWVINVTAYLGVSADDIWTDVLKQA